MANRQLLFGLLLSSYLFGTALGKLDCEDLPVEDCAFSVASSGTRCVLEKYRSKEGSVQYVCQSSIITAEKQEEWIESDECVNACGLERMSVGLSTDLLLDSHFADMFCSAECLNNCPNLIDLYISLAAGEGMYLPQLCKTHRTRRVIADPVKKAMDAEYLRTVLPKLISGSDAAAPSASPIPQSGAGAGSIPGSWLPTGPDYRGYGGTTTPPPAVSGGSETTAAAPVAGATDTSTTPIPVPQLAGPQPRVSAPVPVEGPSSTKRPFFVIPPATSPQTWTESQGSPPPGVLSQGMPPPVPSQGLPPPVPASTESTAAAAPSLDPSAELDSSWQQKLTELPDHHYHLNEEDQYLYETYFH